MKYLYYPGCSLKGTGRAYEESLLAVFETLGLPLEELGQWNCCGATAYMAIDELQAFALAARNLALASEAAGSGPVSLVAPCSACYLVLVKVKRYMAEYDELGRTVADALKETGLSYHGDVLIRHPLDVLVNDIGLDKVAECTTAPLEGLKVACYYGCQTLRPFSTFDDRYRPMTMDHIVEALGAEAVDWPLKTRCCGGSLTGTIQETGLRLSYILLKEARNRGAEVLLTCCPLCQFNLECFQPQMNKMFEADCSLPVVYFTQLMGRAMGIDDRTLGLHRLFTTLTTSPAAVSRSPA
ncbi:MAG: CoB--CoM heterodisulfide reductase iron-sulfur subunit B family protein [Planctomycetota bacterium]|jgi:heterodisulfide reductase subunit B